MKTTIYEIINLILYGETITDEDLDWFFQKMSSYKVSSKAKLELINQIIDIAIEELIDYEDYRACHLLTLFRQKCEETIGKKRNRPIIQ